MATSEHVPQQQDPDQPGSRADPYEGRSPGRRPRAQLKNLGRICGAVGMVLWISTPLTWLLTSEWGPLVWGKLICGAFGIGLYLFTNADFFARLAGSRSTGFMAMSATSIVLVLGLVGAVNYVALTHAKEFDLTREGLYTLSEQTQSLLARLSTDVHVMAFYASYDPLYAGVQEILERYKHLSSKLDYQMVDPQSRPDLVEKYHITERGPRLVITAGHGEARAKEPTEQEITQALVKVAEQTSKGIYFLTGHGEGDILDGEHAEGYKALAEAIRAEGYTVESLNLLNTSSPAPTDTHLNLQSQQNHAALHISDQAHVVVIAGLQDPVLAPEVNALETYVKQGGRLLVMLEPHRKSGLEGFLKTWKIEVQDDIIVDPSPIGRLLGLGPAAPMVHPVKNGHPIVKDQRTAVILYTARSLAVGSEGFSDVTVQELLRTSETAWGETKLGPDGSASRDEEDHLPPLAVALAASQDVKEEASKRSDQARLVVIGDAHGVNNRYIGMQGNQDFILNTLSWLAEQEEKISIRPKARPGSQLFLSGDQLSKLKFFSMDILPVLLVALGLGVVLIRRQR